jgi:hypothetical protein
MHPHHRSFFQRHSLSIIASFILLLWILLYIVSNPATHMGSFYGNAIADWSGVVVTVIATKFLYERGSVESRRPPPDHAVGRVRHFIHGHSLSIFLVITLGAWAFAFARMDPNAKWGQVVGNIVSEWTQQLGVVLLTKRFIEVHSKESRA